MARPAPHDTTTLAPSSYWTGTRHGTRYVCGCANWYFTADELRVHIHAEHPETKIIEEEA